MNHCLPSTYPSPGYIPVITTVEHYFRNIHAKIPSPTKKQIQHFLNLNFWNNINFNFWLLFFLSVCVCLFLGWNTCSQFEGNSGRWLWWDCCCWRRWGFRMLIMSNEKWRTQDVNATTLATDVSANQLRT